MYSFISIITLIFLTKTAVISQKEETNQIQSLCENPIINSADRLINNSVRLYRGQYYWLLNGLPDPVGFVEGPFKIWYLNMGPIFRNNTVVTLLSGADKGSVFKTQGMFYWAWNANGEQWAGGVKGNYWEKLPDGGLEAAFHDGNVTQPTFVGFKSIKVYYYSTKFRFWIGSRDGYINGQFGENFPADLTAAFSWPADDPKDEYIVYLFKRDKFCKRTKILKSGKNCDQWIDNKVLFGCSGSATGSELSNGSNPSEIANHAPSQPSKGRESSDDEPVTELAIKADANEEKIRSFSANYTGSLALILILISFKFSLN